MVIGIVIGTVRLFRVVGIAIWVLIKIVINIVIKILIKLLGIVIINIINDSNNSTNSINSTNSDWRVTEGRNRIGSNIVTAHCIFWFWLFVDKYEL